MKREPGRTILEIGCSNGAFLARIAAAHPLSAFIGLDWKYKLVFKGCEKSEKLGNVNTAFLRARAQECEAIFAPGELDEIWLFFPDPWPKTAQQKHRLFQEAFLKSAAKLLKPGGHLHIKTDHPGYYQWMLAVMGIDFDEEAGAKAILPLGEGKSRRNRQVLHRTLENKDLPEASKSAAADFEVVARSYDFWADEPALGEKFADQKPLFWSETTLFEALFRKDKLHVFFLSLKKR
jgi:tRNA (guanine-N(7)-)-methyltransferase